MHPSYYGIGSVERVHVPKVRYNNEGHWNTLRDVRRSNEDSYHYSYETENGIRAAEDAHLENKNINAGTMKKSGFYEYQGDDGKTYRVDYVADENGYRAQVKIKTFFYKLKCDVNRVLIYLGGSFANTSTNTRLYSTLFGLYCI